MLTIWLISWLLSVVALHSDYICNSRVAIPMMVIVVSPILYVFGHVAYTVATFA